MEDDFPVPAGLKVRVEKQATTAEDFFQLNDGANQINFPGDVKDTIDPTRDKSISPMQTASSSTHQRLGNVKSQDALGKDRSVSTKETSFSTVSTSLRSGLSSIQNAAAMNSVSNEDVFIGTEASPVNGSMSMRTGLSSIQIQTVDPPEADDIEASSSTRDGSAQPTGSKGLEPKVADASERSDIDSQKSSSMHHSNHISQRPKVPDTIIEEEEESSGIINARSESARVAKEAAKEAASKATKNDESATPAATTNISSTKSSPSKSQSQPQPQPQSQSPQKSPKKQSKVQTKGKPAPKSLPKPLPQQATNDLKAKSTGLDTDLDSKSTMQRIVTKDDTLLDASNIDASQISEGGSSKQSWWKKKKAGMKMSSVIKQVLAKASPRHGISPSPKDRPQTQQPVGFSDDEDESIFGGLEDDNTIDDAKKKLSLSSPKPSRSQNVNSRKNDKNDSILEKKTNKESKRSARSNEGSSFFKKSPRTPTKESKSPTKESKSKPNKDVIEKAAAKLKKLRTQPLSPLAAATNANSLYTNPNSLYSNDRSGTVVDESEVLEGVNSDITSSLLGGNGSYAQKKDLKSKKSTPDKPKMDDGSKKKDPIKEGKAAKTPKMGTSSQMKNGSSSSRKMKSGSSRTKSSGTLTDTLGKLDDDDKQQTKTSPTETEDKAAEKAEDEAFAGESESNEDDLPKEPSGSIFMNFGCGFIDSCAATMTNACNFGSKVNLSEDVIGEEDGFGSITSSQSHSQSQLTDLEKRIWNDWDRLDESTSKVTNNDEVSAIEKENQEKKEKKREAARGKLLQIAGSAISSQMSVTKADDDERGLSSDYTGSTDSSGESGSGESSGVSGESGMSSTSSGPVESQSYYSGNTESEFTAQSPSSRKDEESQAMTPSAVNPPPTPILLSFSQKSLVERFAKQLGKDGVQVLKLNTRKQWQVRYFTVSKEKTPLTAHGVNSKSKNVAHCPNALLWLKKFNSKSGGYGISNIDKTGHGGMLLVGLVDVHVSTQADKEHPIPKKLKDKFKEPVLLTIDYVMDVAGTGKDNRSISFCCKDNDEAQFICTCMRVIRDLLKREVALRIKNGPSK